MYRAGGTQGFDKSKLLAQIMTTVHYKYFFLCFVDRTY